MSENELHPPYWTPPVYSEEDLAHQVEHERTKHLLLDPRPRTETSSILIDAARTTTLRAKFIMAFLTGVLIITGVTWLYQMITGLGITGLTRPTMWALYIVNFVYFIGIGHAGTFISAALRVLGIEWRRPISRAAEIVTVFGLGTAALFPIIHIGRAWKAYWLIPYPNERQLWPSYHSPLIWDFTAITTYLTCSILFAYIALIPDLAIARDLATGWRKKVYAALALGFRGTEKEWVNEETALNIFSYAIIPVMFSVHTVVSWDFAMALQPGWHSTIFGPYFVIGALFSGVGAVIIALAAVRKFMHLDYFLRPEHFNGMGKFLLILAFFWAYFYFNDYLIPWYGQNPAEFTIFNVFSKMLETPQAFLWYLMLFCNVLIPWVTLWSYKVRTNIAALVIVSIFVQIGMYLERVIIIPVTLGWNELPFSWGVYFLQAPETIITIGAFCFMILLYILFTRIFPIIPAWEVYEGQVIHRLRRIGRGLVDTKVEPE